MSRTFERLIAELAYSILFAIYGIVLIVWYMIYNQIAEALKKNNKFCK